MSAEEENENGAAEQADEPTTEPAPEAEAPEATPEPEAPEADAEESQAAPEPEVAPEVAEAAPEAETDAEPEADAEPETDAEADPAPEADADTEPAEKPEPAKQSGSKDDVVPGANLEPIAITEERELSAEERAALEAEEEERARAEAEAVRDTDDDDELPAKAAAAVPKDASIQATGKRKSSVARVLLRAGDGKIAINGREIEDYFPRPHHQSQARQPLVTTGYDSNVDLQIRVHGGGVAGQAGAVRHGIARALVELNGELRGDLKRRGFLTRDAREKERRKAGLKKARKRPQFSKR